MVVYDQSTKDAGQLSKDGFVHILLSKLDGTFHKVSLLTGKGCVAHFLVSIYPVACFLWNHTEICILDQQRELLALSL